MSIKVLLVIDKFSLGAGRVVYDLAKFLDKKRFSVSIACIYPGGEYEEKVKELGIKVININKAKGIGLGTILNLRDVCKGYDIVHTHNVDAYEYGVLGAKLANVSRRVHTAHGKSVKKGFFKSVRERIFHKFVSYYLHSYVAVSRDLAKYAKRWSFRKISVVHNGIDVNKYKFREINMQIPGVGKNDLLVGIVAGLRKVKDHKMLFRAFSLVKKEINGVKLIVVGDGPEMSSLVDYVNKLGLEKDVLFMEARDDVVDLYNVFDVCVLSSLSECLSMTLLEAMSCSRAFVATDVGGNSEVITDKENGFLVNSGNSKLMANRITHLLKHPVLCKQMGAKARERVIKDFTVGRMVTEYEKIYTKSLN